MSEPNRCPTCGNDENCQDPWHTPAAAIEAPTTSKCSACGCNTVNSCAFCGAALSGGTSKESGAERELSEVRDWVRHYRNGAISIGQLGDEVIRIIERTEPAGLSVKADTKPTPTGDKSNA